MEPFKNNISPQLVTCIADHLEKHLDAFDRRSFESSIQKTLLTLELKERAQLIADHMHKVLPSNLKTRNKIIQAMLHPNDYNQTDQQSDEQGIRGWGMFPLSMVVGQHGLENFQGSLLLLKEMTSRFSSEFDVRYFLLADQARTLRIMARWVNDGNHHVRRLVSEGTRPRLPWAMRLPQLVADPSPILLLLEALRDDKEEYVRRSVANNLNDISKDHPDLVAKLAEQWLKGASQHRKKLVRHACRTNIRQRHPETFRVLGYSSDIFEVTNLTLKTPTVAFGEALSFSVTLRSKSKVSEPFILDYCIYHKKANGKQTPKVFKWRTSRAKAGEVIVLKRHHAIRPITTRKYYSGQHKLSILLNGVELTACDFDLVI